MNQFEFENCVINYLAQGNSTGVKLLEQQFSNARVTSREMTGAGFFVCYLVDRSKTRPFKVDVSFGDLAISFDGLQFGAGAVVHIRSGYIEMLECYSYDEDWPEQYENVTIRYVSEERQLEELDSAA